MQSQNASEETAKLRPLEDEDWLDSVDSSAPISPDVEVEWMKALLFVHTMCRSSWGRFAQVRGSLAHWQPSRGPRHAGLGAMCAAVCAQWHGG
jgi:hypothetical protein